MKNESLGTILAVLTAIVSGFAIIANKAFVVNMDPLLFTSVRAMLIGIAFFIISSIKCKFDYKKFKKVPWKYLILIGLIGGAFAFLFFFTGLKLTTGGRAAFLHKTLPIYVMIFAYLFLKEKIKKKHVFALILMFIGLILIISSQIEPNILWSDPTFGDVLVILATVLWGLENTIAKYVMKRKESNFIVSFGRMFFGAIFLFGLTTFLGNFDSLFVLTTQEIISILVSTLILFDYVFLWYYSIKLINVSKAASFLLLAPIVSLILGVVIFGETVPLIQLLGSALILAGAYMVSKIKSEFVQAV
jgi:drug/metabolite transporter (DMT)-like permease